MPKNAVEPPEPNPEIQRLIEKRDNLIRDRTRFARNADGRSKAFQDQAAAQFNYEIAAVEAEIARLRASEPES